MQKRTHLILLATLVLAAVMVIPAAAKPPCGHECVFNLQCSYTGSNLGCSGPGRLCLEYPCFAAAVVSSDSSMTPDEYGAAFEAEMEKILATLDEAQTWELVVEKFGASDYPFRIVGSVEGENFENEAYSKLRKEIADREKAGEQIAECAPASR